MMPRNKMLIILGAFLLPLSACSKDNSGASREAAATMQATEQAAVSIGMPAILNFTEKRQLKTIYELRDQANLVTYTYIIDLNGKRHKVCPSTSVGFGIPYATQYSAPKALRMAAPLYPDGSQWTGATLDKFEADQPEPNALYMPQAADATWVMCLNPTTKQLAPTYVEPHIVVYTFEMTASD